MKKIAAFIVEKRAAVLAVFLALAVAGAVMMNFVSVNFDMTSYLPADSAAKKGIVTLTEEFGESSVVNLMFKNLSEADRDRILAELSSIEHVDSVVYDADSDEYNRDGNTLFVVTIAADTYSPEAARALEEIEDRYKSDYDAYTSGPINDSRSVGVSGTVLILAFSILIVILLIMCTSWIEPVLFLIAIGVAVLLNEGTNVIFGSVSSMTKSIAAILQLVLSIDYSIMLIDRYRQERATHPDKMTAMKKALSGGFLAIAGSSATTIVGLLCLIFMSFTIGMDMGLVLAKGVFFSLVSILFVLPALMLIFDKAIERTRKKALAIPTGALARFEHKFRFIILPVFLALFVAGFILKDHVLIDFSMSSQNPDKPVIEDVFPATNTLMLLYDNTDEDKIDGILKDLASRDGVKSVNAYADTLGRPYAAAEMADEMGLDKSLLDVLYYEYFKDGETGSLTLPEFMRFVLDDVSQNEQFADYFTDGVRDELDRFAVFADPAALTERRDAAGLAAMLDMDEADVGQLLLLYQMERGGSGGRLSLSEFVRFVRADVASDPQYAAYLDADALAGLDTLAAFTETAAINRPYTSAAMADRFGMDEALTGQLYYLYHAAAGDNTASWTMTLPIFLEFLLDDIAADPQYAAYFDDAALAQLSGTRAMIGAALSGASLTSAELAAMTGMDAAMIDQLFGYAAMTSGTPVAAMTLPDFLDFILNDIANNPQFAPQFDNAALTRLGTLKGLIDAARADRAFPAAELAAATGMDEALTGQLFYAYYSAQGATQGWTMSPVRFVDFIVNRVAADPQYAGRFDQATLAQLTTLKSIMDAASSGKACTAAELAGMVGMEADALEALFLYHQSLYGDTSGWALSLKELVDFIADDVAGSDAYAGYMDADALEQVTTASTVIDAVLDATAYTAEEMAGLLSGMDGLPEGELMSADTLELLYLYYFGTREADASWTLSLYEFMTFVAEDVLTDSRFASYFDGDAAAQMADAKAALDAGRDALVGPRYSRLIITTTYGEEAAEVYALIEDLQETLGGGFADAYIVGNSYVAYEMRGSFSQELNFITLLTVLAVFLVVAVTFRSLAVPAILVLLIQCAVYMTTAAAYFQGSGTYYLAMIIVQAILMGATIDYAILYTEYYRQLRRTEGVRPALAGAYKGSIMTILTSSSILFAVTLVVGLVAADPTTAQVCLTIAKGCFFSVLLVIFVLPALLALFDRLVCGKRRFREDSTKPAE